MLPTLRTVPGYVKAMINDLKLMLLSQALFYILQFLFNELDHLAAFNAPQMTVMPVTINRLIVHVPILMPDLLYQTTLHDQWYVPVYGSL